MINKILKLLLFSTLLLLFSTKSNATHMVGGDFTYRCLGNGYFEIKLTIRRDCYLGADDAEFDEKAVIAIFDQYNGPLKPNQGGLLLLTYQGSDTLDESLNRRCGVLGDDVCVHEAVYIDTIKLPRPLPGRVHRLYYQRCCRNESLLNIENPLETGNSYMIEIDEFAYDECNNSPEFKDWPEIYICAGESLEFDHSAEDIDGDSLVYSLYTPFIGGSIVKPKPEVHADFVPFLNRKVTWKAGFSKDNVFGSNDPLTIDTRTGLITGTPDNTGQYLVGVQVDEYRNGELIGFVRRDFEYNVRECVAPPEPIIESVDAICGSATTDTLELVNASLHADSYTWSIYTFSTGQTVTSTNSDKVDFVYTLPQSGKDTFDITLIAYSQIANCSVETTKRIIAVKDELIADFDVKINECYSDSLDITLNLNDKFDQLNPLYTWKNSKWTIKFPNDTLYATGKVVSVTVPKEDTAFINLYIDTEEGCEAETEKMVLLTFAKVAFFGDTIVVCKGDTKKIIKNPHSEWTYTWSTEEGLDFGANPNDKSNPTFVLDRDMQYSVTVTDGICTDSGTVQIIVKDYFDIKIDGPDTVCVDSVDLTAIGDGSPGNIYQWSYSDSFTSIITEGEHVNIKLNGVITKIYLRVDPLTACSNNIDSITVVNGTLRLDYKKEICYLTDFKTRIEIKGVDNKTKITWEDNPIIVSSLDSNVIFIQTETIGDYYLVFHADSEYGCELTDTIHVFAEEGPELVIGTYLQCGSYEMCFDLTAPNGSDPLSDYHWDFGVEGIDNDTSNLVKDCYTYPNPGKYTVSLSVKIGDCDDKSILEKDIEIPEIIDVNIDLGDSLTYCSGDEIVLKANTNVETANLDWFNGQNKLGTGDSLVLYPKGDMEVYVVGIDSFGCSDTATIYLQEYIFDLTYVDPGVRCVGDTLQLNIINNTDNDLSYSWSGNTVLNGADTNTPTVVVTESTDFEVLVKDLGDIGCDSVFIVSVIVSDIDVYVEADTTELVITNPTNITVYNVPDNSTIQWSTGESDVETITITPTAAEAGYKEYCVTVTDEYGCTDVDCVTIHIIDPACNHTDIYIPNAFSPNGDGNNDVFRARGKYLREVEIEIFDRWGELIFKGSGDEFTNWDGTFRGKALPPDSYAYRVNVQCEDSDRYTQQGNINIIK